MPKRALGRLLIVHSSRCHKIKITDDLINFLPFVKVSGSLHVVLCIKNIYIMISHWFENRLMNETVEVGCSPSYIIQ